MAQQVLSIQELCDELARHIALSASSQGDLRSLALVSHMFCSSAQSQIFCDVNLESTKAPHLPTISIIRRLAHLLATSPHLLRYIRHLTICADSEILKLLVTIRFPALRKIRIRFTYNDDSFLLARHLVGLPSIREVEIAYHCRTSLDDFASLFETCTRSLDSLSFTNVVPSSGPLAAGVPLPGGEPVQIKRLKLYDSFDLVHWFASPSCPFDFTHLAEVEICDSSFTGDSVWPFLTSARLTMTRLRISGCLPLDVKLSDFAAMWCLEIEIYAALRAISGLAPDNRVEILVLHACAREFIADAGKRVCFELDTLLATSSMTALRQVQVQVHGRRPSFNCESLFPQLRARDLLVVTDHRDW
ncbi:hypothetical protein DFH09DRAFT_1128042 [Mycena vulgaris]|nr:hypothetical protein DFH09DRAFT_1128042 [Mycena vulgaris]